MNVTRGLARAAQERQPLWLQVKNSVLAMIRDEELQPDAKLPSESEMCRDFGVSRIVVREAMAQLVAARIIYRLQGKGAFVARRDESLSFVGVTQGFTGELLEQNHVVTRRILKQFLGPAETKARKLLLLGRDEPAVHLDRVLLVDGTPRIVVRTVLPHRLVPGMEQMPMEGKSLHATLQRQYGISFVKAQRWLAAKSATPDLAELLGVDPGAPLLEIESLAHITADRPAEYYLAYYRTDQARVAIAVG